MIKILTASNNAILNNSSLSTSLLKNPNQCLGVVLAGGLSSRMGIDKASLQHNNTNMLNYSKQLLTDSGLNNIVISGEPSCATQQDVIVADKYKAAGPMGGIASVIEKYKPSALLILPVDLPLITSANLQKLMQIGELSQQACFYHDNFLPLYLPVNAHCEIFFNSVFVQYNQQKNNTANVLTNISTNDPKKISKVKNGPSVRALLSQIPHKALTIDSPSSLLNTNTPDEWAMAKKHFAYPKPY